MATPSSIHLPVLEQAYLACHALPILYYFKNSRVYKRSASAKLLH